MLEINQIEADLIPLQFHKCLKTKMNVFVTLHRLALNDVGILFELPCMCYECYDISWRGRKSIMPCDYKMIL